jgi:hypothetical protein
MPPFPQSGCVQHQRRTGQENLHPLQHFFEGWNRSLEINPASTSGGFPKPTQIVCGCFTHLGTSLGELGLFQIAPWIGCLLRDNRQQEVAECVASINRTMKLTQDQDGESLFDDFQLPLASPWWDLLDIKPGLERKQFAAEMAGIQERLCGLVPYVDNLEDRAVLVEAWHVLEGLALARRKHQGKGQAAPQLRNRPRS